MFCPFYTNTDIINCNITKNNKNPKHSHCVPECLNNFLVVSEECDPEQRCNPREDRGEGKRRDTDCFVNGHFFQQVFLWWDNDWGPPHCASSLLLLWYLTVSTNTRRIRPRTHTGQEGTSCSSPALFPEHALTAPRAPQWQRSDRQATFSPNMLSLSHAFSFCQLLLFLFCISNWAKLFWVYQALSRIVWNLWCVFLMKRKYSGQIWVTELEREGAAKIPMTNSHLKLRGQNVLHCAKNFTLPNFSISGSRAIYNLWSHIFVW